MNEFEHWLQEAVRECGGESACCLDLASAGLREKLEENGSYARNWIQSGYAGEMNYLERMLDDKTAPEKAFPGAQSVIVITFKNNWGNPEAEHPFPEVRPGEPLGYISAYAKEQDYHRTGHEILVRLQEKLAERFGELEGTPCVDTKPVFERLLAVLGGLGIRGPNDLLRTPEHDVRVFIGSLFVSRQLPEVILEPKMRFPCTYCQKCSKSCPTGAIREDEVFDAPLCISYLTIEKKGVLDAAERKLLGGWLFGCDWCTVVCPPKDKIDTRIPVELEWLLKTPAGQIRRLLKGSAVEYAGVTKLRRNAVALLREDGGEKAAELLDWARENLKSPLVLEQIQAD